jgi:hypothetical protein
MLMDFGLAGEQRIGEVHDIVVHRSGPRGVELDHGRAAKLLEACIGSISNALTKEQPGTILGQARGMFLRALMYLPCSHEVICLRFQ